MAANRRALLVRGGWDGHVPHEATDSFVPFLKSAGFEVSTSDTLDVYTDADRMAATDLVVQCWTMGAIAEDQLAGLLSAVAAGTGLAGWHGGIADSFRASPEYLRLVGGQFLAHPNGYVDHEIQVVSDHPIVAGIDRVALHTEQYWVLTDPLNEVLATTTLPYGPDTPWQAEVTVPAVWTRRWGAGRVFVSTVGHKMEDLNTPEIRTLTERGLAWASR
jgi:type 1 glutamine amidotransferase